MKRKIRNKIRYILWYLVEKEIGIGNLKFGYSETCGLGEKDKFEFYLDPDCEHCPFGYEYNSYEGECEDCGCYIDHDFNVSKFYCAIPWRIKKLICKVKGWE